MSDKVKGDLLIDYVSDILPQNYDNNGIDIGLKGDFAFNNMKHEYYKPSNNISFRSNQEEIKNLAIYRQVDKFEFSQNFLDNFISIMYMRLIYDVLDNRAVNEHIAPAINKLKSSKLNLEKIFDFASKIDSFWKDKNIVVVNLRNVNLDVRKQLPLLLTNKLYKEHKSLRDNDKDITLNIVVDEAHNILSYQSNRESEEWKDYRLEVFEEIIKEGRKFGVFLTIASQRPSDISSTIISQLHNYFIHRLVNQFDIDQVSRNISFLDKVSADSLSILPTGICVITGQLTELPLLIKIDPIEEEYRPDNETVDLSKAWSVE